LKAAPRYGIGTQKRGSAEAKDKVPDAGVYDPSISLIKNQAPGFKIGTDARKEGFDKKKALAQPGPGNYELTSAAFNVKPRFHMGIKLQDQSKFQSPAPGTYQPVNEVGKNRAPSF